MKKDVNRTALSLLSLMPDVTKADIGMVLGSGLANFVDGMTDKQYLPFYKIKGWYLPNTEVKGHKE